jgi:hypothetical protein
MCARQTPFLTTVHGHSGFIADFMPRIPENNVFMQEMDTFRADVLPFIDADYLTMLKFRLLEKGTLVYIEVYGYRKRVIKPTTLRLVDTGAISVQTYLQMAQWTSAEFARTLIAIVGLENFQFFAGTVAQNPAYRNLGFAPLRIAFLFHLNAEIVTNGLLQPNTLQMRRIIIAAMNTSYDEGLLYILTTYNKLFELDDEQTMEYVSQRFLFEFSFTNDAVGLRIYRSLVAMLRNDVNIDAAHVHTRIFLLHDAKEVIDDLVPAVVL